MAAPPTDVMARFQILLDLYELSEAVVRQNLRRRHPHATDEEIETGVRAWLAKAGEAEPDPWTVVERSSS
jgi:hypothetical protein